MDCICKRVCSVFIVEDACLLLLLTKHLHRCDAGNVLIKKRVHARYLHTNKSIHDANITAKDGCGCQQEGENRNSIEREFPLNAHHEAKNPDKYEDVIYDKNYAGGKQFIERLNIVGNTCY